MPKKKQAEKTSPEAEINFRSLVFDVKVGIFVCDINGDFLYANYALARILGHPRPADIVGKNFYEFLPDEKGILLRNRFQYMQAEESDSPMILAEIPKQKGAPKFIEIFPAPMFKDGKLVGNQGVVHDVTARKLEEESKMKFLSTHDSQTGLFNRIFFEAEMKRLERGRQYPISMAVINVGNVELGDDLKSGLAEEKVLKRLGQTLFCAARGDDIIARIGLDNFALLLPNVNRDMVCRIIERIETEITNKFREKKMADLQLYIGTSTAEKGESLDDALKKAESIAFLAKKKDEGA